jgi:DNA invertase Pin-like site-specific DNA recombinase
MLARAVIYIRTSSKTQGENSSPIEQEADCRHLAEEKGLDVVRVYCDVEKYRVGSQWVKPSGSRSDRPGFVAMLKSASSFIHQFPHEPRHVAAENNDDTKFFINTCVS